MNQEYALVGHPLGHSFSARYFNEKFAHEGVDARYVNFDLKSITELPELLQDHKELRGFNVTIPYKEAVLPLLQRLSPVAAAVGAVNTVVVESDGTLTGHNTDVAGFLQCVRPMLPTDCSGLKALVLGTGGASKAVRYALDTLGISCTLVSRSEAHGRLVYGMLNREVMMAHRIVVNASPVGMYPDTEMAPDIPYECLDAMSVCVDLVYNPPLTEFMRHSLKSGAMVRSGLEMLTCQAEAAWRLWQGEKLAMEQE